MHTRAHTHTTPFNISSNMSPDDICDIYSVFIFLGIPLFSFHFRRMFSLVIEFWAGCYFLAAF